VVQELLRHASLKVTTDVYMQAVSPQKRKAQRKLVKMGLGKSRFQLTGPNWTLKKDGDFAEVLYFVGVPLAIRQTGQEIGDGVVPFCACAKSGRSP